MLLSRTVRKIAGLLAWLGQSARSFLASMQEVLAQALKTSMSEQKAEHQKLMEAVAAVAPNLMLLLTAGFGRSSRGSGAAVPNFCIQRSGAQGKGGI